jgi:hypothetical protein
VKGRSCGRRDGKKVAAGKSGPVAKHGLNDGEPTSS